MSREEDTWWDKYGVQTVVLSIIAVMLSVSLWFWHVSKIEKADHEARCLQARAGILDCLSKGDGEDHWHCEDVNKVKYMCTQWPDSWEGK